jgi:hypothetical protein
MMSSTAKNLTALLLLLGGLGFGSPARAGEPATQDPKAATAKDAKPASPELTLKGTLGCGKCSFHEAKACQNVLKVKPDGKDSQAGKGKDVSYVLADNAVSRANHEKVCGPASPATVTGTVSEHRGKKILTATAIKFE